MPTVAVYGSRSRRRSLGRVSGDFSCPPSIHTLTLGWFWELDADVLPVDLLQLVDVVKQRRLRCLRTVRLQSQTTKHVVGLLSGYFFFCFLDSLSLPTLDTCPHTGQQETTTKQHASD